MAHSGMQRSEVSYELAMFSDDTDGDAQVLHAAQQKHTCSELVSILVSCGLIKINPDGSATVADFPLTQLAFSYFKAGVLNFYWAVRTLLPRDYMQVVNFFRKLRFGLLCMTLFEVKRDDPNVADALQSALLAYLLGVTLAWAVIPTVLIGTQRFFGEKRAVQMAHVVSSSEHIADVLSTMFISYTAQVWPRSFTVILGIFSALLPTLSAVGQALPFPQLHTDNAKTTLAITEFVGYLASLGQTGMSFGQYIIVTSFVDSFENVNLSDEKTRIISGLTGLLLVMVSTVFAGKRGWNASILNRFNIALIAFMAFFIPFVDLLLWKYPQFVITPDAFKKYGVYFFVFAAFCSVISSLVNSIGLRQYKFQLVTAKHDDVFMRKIYCEVHNFFIEFMQEVGVPLRILDEEPALGQA